MAKLTNVDESGLAESLPLRAPEGQQSEVEGARLVTILYSHNREVYRAPAIDKPCWLSVKVYDLPVTQLAADAIYLGPSTTADGLRWRKAYSRSWCAIVSGNSVPLPADDAMVRDYQAFKC
jgi:hypothetical protein